MCSSPSKIPEIAVEVALIARVLLLPLSVVAQQIIASKVFLFVALLRTSFLVRFISTLTGLRRRPPYSTFSWELDVERELNAILINLSLFIDLNADIKRE